MGLFRTEPVADDLAAVLCTNDNRSRKAVAKGQRGIREALLPGEEVAAIAVEEFTYNAAVVVTDRRLLTMSQAGRDLMRAVDIAQVAGAYVTQEPGGAARVKVQDLNVQVYLGDRARAEVLARRVNEMVLRNRPRRMPEFHPVFVEDLLSRTGVPDTPVNRVRLVERTAFMIGTQAAAMAAQLRDPDAFTAFTTRFATTDPGRELQRADDMIDWLWAWHPLCHAGLERQMSRWHDGLLEPDGFLAGAAGGEIPPWSDGTGDDRQAWQMVYDKNHRA